MSTHAENVHLMNENSDLRKQACELAAALRALLRARADHGQPPQAVWAGALALLERMGVPVYLADQAIEDEAANASNRQTLQS